MRSSLAQSQLTKRKPTPFNSVSWSFMVEHRGIEPLTSGLQSLFKSLVANLPSLSFGKILPLIRLDVNQFLMSPVSAALFSPYFVDPSPRFRFCGHTIIIPMAPIDASLSFRLNDAFHAGHWRLRKLCKSCKTCKSKTANPVES